MDCATRLNGLQKGDSMDDKYNCHYDDNDTSTNNYRGTYHYEPNFEEQKPEPPNTVATASLVLGILSLVLCCCCYVSIPLGGLGILFAILSKTGKAMQGRAKTGLSLSIVGLCLTLFLTIAMIASTISNGEFQRQYQYYQEYFENTL